MLTRFVKDNPAILRGLFCSFCMRVAHEFKDSAFGTNQAMSSLPLAVEIITKYAEIEVIYRLAQGRRSSSSFLIQLGSDFSRIYLGL